jgi:hypothetical protein
MVQGMTDLDRIFFLCWSNDYQLYNRVVLLCRRTKGDDEDEEGDEDEDEEEEEEESEEEESEEEVAGSTAIEKPELSRADRKALKKQGKKKQTAAGEDEEEEDEDPLLANPNRAIGSMKISDLGKSREPTRKER